MDSITPQHILEFWFDESHPSQWFIQDDSFDTQIKEKFLDTYQNAVAGKLDHWADKPQGALALIIVLDQFSRNLFRNDARAYAQDDKALDIAKKVIANEWDKDMSVKHRRFIYLPFEHSEDIQEQKTSLKLFGLIKNQDESAYDYAVKHYKIIEEYGRYPYRNDVLGRTNTPAEIQYLKKVEETGKKF